LWSMGRRFNSVVTYWISVNARMIMSATSSGDNIRILRIEAIWLGYTTSSALLLSSSMGAPRSSHASSVAQVSRSRPSFELLTAECGIVILDLTERTIDSEVGTSLGRSIEDQTYVTVGLGK
jgi:hypothetical protein